MVKARRRFRHSAGFGKRQEFIVMAELLRRGFDVYVTLVDDQGIDCIIRRNTKPPSYLDIQIKARSKEAVVGGGFGLRASFQPRPNYFVVFAYEGTGDYWILPSRDAVKFGRIQKSGAHKGSITLNLAGKRGVPSRKFERYRSRFDLLEGR